MKKKLLALFALLLIPSLSFAGEDGSGQSLTRPTSGEVKKVLDHLYKGQGNGMFLYEAKICKTIEKHDCVEAVESNTVTVGDELKMWMYFFGPTDDTAVINYDFKKKGRTKKAGTINITGSYRYRTNLTLQTDSVGDWELELYQEIGDTVLDLGKITYSVTEKPEEGLLEKFLGD